MKLEGLVDQSGGSLIISQHVLASPGETIVTSRDMLVLRADEILATLRGRELEMIEIVRQAYETHQQAQSSLPHSTFLLFPEAPQNRIIALPTYLGGEFQSAGVKWISSFPNNIHAGLERASAVTVINSAATGKPEALLEGSIISAKRTAASAALAARTLHAGTPDVFGLIGCGVINLEILRFVSAVFPKLQRIMVFDLSAERATQFMKNAQEVRADLRFELAPSLDDLLAAAPLISFATTAGTPYLNDLSACQPGTTILHISLRDLAPAVILAADNVVDDLDHVSRASTSIHLTEQQVGNREFVRCSLAEITAGHAAPRQTADGLTIFSPFGLGVLDIALCKLVLDQARISGAGVVVPDFLPAAWDAPQIT